MTKRRPVGTEEDILSEIDGDEDPDDPNGPVLIDEEKARELGALDAESIRSNRQNQDIVDRKVSGEKGIPFAEENILLKYEQVIKVWGVQNTSIIVKKLTGNQSSEYITSQPKNASELYTALKLLHGRSEETAYELIYNDSQLKQKRGRGKITLPSTLNEPVQGQSIMNPYGQPPMPGYPQQQSQQAAPSPPVVQVVSPSPQQAPDQIMKQMLEMMVLMKQHFQPPPPPMPAQPPPPSQPQPDMAAMFAMMQQMMQPGSQPPVAPPPPPVPQVIAYESQAPDQLMMMKQMFDMFLQMQRAVAPPPSPPAFREPEPYRGPRARMTEEGYSRPAYSPRPQSDFQDDAYGHGPRSPYPYPPPPPPKPRTATEELRDAVTLINQVSAITEQNRPQQQQQFEAPDVEDDNPVRIVEAGPAKLVLNKDDGSTRMFETAWANAPKIMEWVGEQFNNLQKNAIAAQQRQQPQAAQQLPSGYVELTPGYQPPPGMVAIPVDHIPQDAFPAPPVNLPPPIDAPPAQRTPWGVPSIPGDGR